MPTNQCTFFVYPSESLTRGPWRCILDHLFPLCDLLAPYILVSSRPVTCSAFWITHLPVTQVVLMSLYFYLILIYRHFHSSVVLISTHLPVHARESHLRCVLNSSSYLHLLIVHFPVQLINTFTSSPISTTHPAPPKLCCW